MSEDQNSADKTEKPTQKRIEKAYEEGNFPISKEINQFASILTFCLLIATVIPYSFLLIKNSLINFINFENILIKKKLFNILCIIIVPCIALMIVPFIVGMVQTQGKWSAKQIQPKWSNLSLKKGIKKIFSINNLMQFLQNILKIIILSAIFYIFYTINLSNFDEWSVLTPAGIATKGLELIILLLTFILILFTFVAIFDLWFKRFQFLKSIRMTKQEVKDELKEMEGDHALKSKRKSFMKELQKIKETVPKATVIITNPTHYSVALYWNKNEMLAPIVSAKGIGSIALKIQEIARENKVPVIENQFLARKLYQDVSINAQIPKEHYRAVAEIIKFVMRKI